MASNLRAVLFDWSGTLVDDIYVVWRTNDLTLMSFGLPHQKLETFKQKFFLPWQEFYASFGVKGDEIMKEVDTRFWRIYQPLSSMVKVFHQSKPALVRLKERGLKVGVVTQTKRGPLEEQIRRFRMSDLIDVAVGEEDSEELKPSPKPILSALERLDVAPEASVYVGDMAEDVLAAKRAGVKAISLIWKGSYHTEERVRPYGPDHIAHSLYEAVDIILSL